MHLPRYFCNDLKYILLKVWSELFKLYSRIESSTMFGHSDNSCSCQYMNSCQLPTRFGGTWHPTFLHQCHGSMYLLCSCKMLESIAHYNSIYFSHDYRFIFYFCRWFKSWVLDTFYLDSGRHFNEITPYLLFLLLLCGPSMCPVILSKQSFHLLKDTWLNWFLLDFASSKMPSSFECQIADCKSKCNIGC